MAYSPSPTSPLAGQGSGFVNRASPTPPQQPVTKRDKRRMHHNAIQQDLQADFHNNREAHYRAQLLALQHDMNLIAQADPYNPESLEDAPEEMARIAEMAGAGTPYQHEMSALAGRWYSSFVQEINETKEAAEIEMIRLKVNFLARRFYSSALQLTSLNRESMKSVLHDSNTNAIIDST